MDEPEQTVRHDGLSYEPAPALQRVLESIAALNLAKPAEDGPRKAALQDTLTLLGDNGFLGE